MSLLHLPDLSRLTYQHAAPRLQSHISQVCSQNLSSVFNNLMNHLLRVKFPGDYWVKQQNQRKQTISRLKITDQSSFLFFCAHTFGLSNIWIFIFFLNCLILPSPCSWSFTSLQLTFVAPGPRPRPAQLPDTPANTRTSRAAAFSFGSSRESTPSWANISLITSVPDTFVSERVCQIYRA